MLREEKLEEISSVKIKEYGSNLGSIMLRSRQKGSILIGIIITMVVMASLGAGMVYLTTTSTFQELFANNHSRAYYSAESGGRYAMAVIRKAFASSSYLSDTDYITLKNSSDASALYTFGGNTFKVQNIVVTGSTTKQVDFDVTGIVNASSFLQAQRKLSYRIIPANQTGGSPSSTPPLPIYEDGTSLANWTASSGGWGSVGVNTTEGALEITGVNQGKGGTMLGYGSANYHPLYDAWVNQGNKLSYMAQIKVKSTTPLFSAGLLFRVNDETGANYHAIGLSFVNSNATEIDKADAQHPIDNVPLIVLWQDDAGQSNSMITLAYKQLDAFPSTIYFQDNFNNLNNWTMTRTGENTTNWALNSTNPYSASNSVRSGRSNETTATTTTTMALRNAVNVVRASNLSFWHRGTFDTNHTGIVSISYDGGSSYTPVRTYSASVGSWTKVTGIPVSLGAQVKVKFVVSNTSGSNDTINRWYIDDIRITDQLPDYSTLLVRVEEKELTSTDVTSGFSVGQRVADIRAYYSSKTNDGACNTTATDDNREGNPKNQNPPCWPPCSPADTSCTTTTINGVVCTKDCFTLVTWNSPLPSGSVVTLLSDGYTLRTANSAFLTPTTNLSTNRAEFGIDAFGNNVANNIFFDDFAVNFSCFSGSTGGGGTDGSGSVTQTP
jgi:Tfp pilus assembly protein PilX